MDIKLFATLALISTLILLIPANAQYTVQYDPNTHILVLRNSTYFELKIYYIYNISKSYNVTRILYDPASNTYNNTTLGRVFVNYEAVNYVTIENVWSNGTLTLEMYPSFRRDLFSKKVTLNKNEKVVLPRDVYGYPGIYNITVRVGGVEFKPFILEVEKTPERIKIDLDTGKIYDNSVVIGDNAYVKINALGLKSFNWEILGLFSPLNGTVSLNSPNDEVWFIFNTSWLSSSYNLQPKTYTFHIFTDKLNSYKTICVSEPIVQVSIEDDKITSGKELTFDIRTNVLNTNSSLDGTENRLYVAIVRGIYTGSVNVTKDNLTLPDSNAVPMFMLYKKESMNVSVDESGVMELKYLIDAPGFENVTYWTVVAVVVTNVSAGTKGYFYGVAYGSFSLVVPKIEVYTVLYKNGEYINETNFLRCDKFQIRGYAELPFKAGLLTPNYVWIFVERGSELGISANRYRLFGLKGTLEKVYVQNEEGYFESSIWSVNCNAPFGCYRVFAIITDGGKPREDNIMNMTWINVTVVRPKISVNIEEKVPPGSTLVIHGYSQSKYVYVYASDDVFENIPDTPYRALKIKTFKSGKEREFKFVGIVKETADFGNYSLFFYASDQETFDVRTCLDEAVAKFQIVPLEVKPENLTVIRGENDLLVFHLNGEMRCKVKYKFKVTTGYTYSNLTYPFGMVYEGEKYVCGKTFIVPIPTHYNDRGLTFNMGERSIPPGKYPLKIWVYSNRTNRPMFKKTFYVNVVDPVYNVSTSNQVINGEIVVYRGEKLNVTIKTNRKCYYDWLFFALESEFGLQKYGWLEIVNGIKKLEIETDELEGSNFTFYLIDLMGSGNKTQFVKRYWLIPAGGYEKILMNGILVKIHRGNPYTRSEKGDDDLIMVFKVKVIENVSLNLGNYTYWFPLVVNDSKVYVHAIYDNTDLFVDLNYNGLLDQNEPRYKIDIKDGWKEIRVISNCIKLVSDKPIVTFYRFSKPDKYKDLAFEYSPSSPGKTFVVPKDGYAYITACDKNTSAEVIYGKTHHVKFDVKVGDVLKLRVLKGMILKSADNISVVLADYDLENGDYSWATSLIPTSEFGNILFLPPKIDARYSDYKYLKCSAYITHLDGTVKVVELKDEVQRVKTEKPAVAYVFFDAYARDFGSEVYRLKHYTFAFKVYPLSELGTKGIAFTLISTLDGNVVCLDTNRDGAFDKTVFLNESETYNPPTETKSGIHSLGEGLFKSKYPVFVYSVSVFNENGSGGETSAFAYKPFESVKIVLPVKSHTIKTPSPTVVATIPTTIPTQTRPTPTPVKSDKIYVVMVSFEDLQKLIERYIEKLVEEILKLFHR